MDCAGIGQDNISEYLEALKNYKFSKYITLKSPMIKNFDEYGLLFGAVRNVADLASVNLISGILPKTSSVRWGFFIPLESALIEINEKVTKKQVSFSKSANTHYVLAKINPLSTDLIFCYFCNSLLKQHILYKM